METKRNIAGLQAWVLEGTSSETGIPVLLVHGGPGVPDYLGDLAASIHNITQLTVVRYDQRGVGGSRFSTDITVANHISDIESIRESLMTDKIHLVGHSWGGLLSLMYAKQHSNRVSSLTLLSPSIGCGREWVTMEEQVMKYNQKQAGMWQFTLMGLNSLRSMILPAAWGGDAGMRSLMAQVWKNYFTDPNSAPLPDVTWLQGCSSKASRDTRNDVVTIDPVEGMPSDDLLVESGIQLLVLFGSRDIYGPVGIEKMTARYPSFQVSEVEGSGHLLWIDQPKLVQDYIANQLSVD